MSDLTDSEVFSYWQDHVSKDLGKAKYTAENNKNSVQDLVREFHGRGFGIDVVRGYQRKTIEFLVTEEGLKGGKSKRTGKSLAGWTDSVKTYYQAAIVDFYSEPLAPANNKPLPVSVKDPITDYLMTNELVKAWVIHKFGKLDENILYETCRDTTSLNLQMQNDLFNSNWSYTGENIPDYVKKVLA